MWRTADCEDLTVAEALEQAPEGTEIVVLNDEGEVEPLATEEAAEIVARSSQDVALYVRISFNKI